MKIMTRRLFGAALILAGLSLTAPRAFAAPPTEAKVVAELSSTKEATLIDGLADTEKYFPKSDACLPLARKCLADSRPKVVRKAAYVLGNIHADVSEEDLANICKLFDSKDKTDVIDALKGLRGLKAQSTIPKILPLLQNPDNNVKRDTCRTLKVLGDKSLIPSIEPLLKFPDDKVQQDAADAISVLKLK